MTSEDDNIISLSLSLSLSLSYKMRENYLTIMMSSTIAMFYSNIMEKKVSAWAESQNKQAFGQVSFRSKHSMVDHLVTLRIIVEKS